MLKFEHSCCIINIPNNIEIKQRMVEWLNALFIMEITIGFIIGSLFCLYYGFKVKNDKGNRIRFPILIGILIFLFAVFNFFEYIIAEIIVGIPLIILIFGNNLFGKILDRKKL